MEDKKTLRVFEFNPQVYPRRLYVAIGPNPEELNDYFRFLDGSTLNYDMSGKGGATLQIMRAEEPKYLGVLIYFPEDTDLTWQNLAHEMAHAALYIFDDIGCTAGDATQEPFAYLCGWIMSCLEQAKNNKAEALK